MSTKKYDLEERTLVYAQGILQYIKSLPHSVTTMEVSKQLIRAACSVGANYREANESLSKKDFTMRMKISRKEVKESEYWLRLTEPLKEHQSEQGELIQESIELRKIFGAIIEKSKELL